MIKMVRNIFDVICEIGVLEDKVRYKYGLEEDWYGETLPSEIIKIIDMMRCANDSETYRNLANLAEGVFEELAKHKIERDGK